MHRTDGRGRSGALETAARDRGLGSPEPDSGGAEPGSGHGPQVSRVPESHVHDTFDVDGIDTKRRESLLEALLVDRDGVSAASATARNGIVGIHHDPDRSRDALRDELESYGLVVAQGDEAFASRRAAQFDAARVAVAVLFGLMVVVPYVGVLYPTRIEWLFYDPVTVAYLQSLLDSRVATHFFVNLAVLSGVAFLVACGPTIRRAVAAAKTGRATNEAAFVAGVVGVYAYSTLAAFTGFGGAVHYDIVAYAVVGATLWTRYDVDATVTDADPDVSTDSDVEPVGSAVDEGAPTTDDDGPVAMTDGGR